MNCLFEISRAAAELMGWLVIGLVTLGLFIKFFGESDV